MTKTVNNKLRLLYLQQILEHETNEQYPLSVEELIQKLADVGLQAERKTIYSDLKLLEEFGLDLIRDQRHANHANYYYIGAHDFELPEVKLLIDAVQFAKFITPKKSRELIDKICRLTNRHEAQWLQSRLVLGQMDKRDNEQIYLSLDVILTALREKKRLTFTYWGYDLQRQLVAKRDGELYEVSPYALALYEHRYYLLAYHTRYAKIVHFRVDKLKHVTLSELPRQEVPDYANFNVATYTKGVFSMMNGEQQAVELCWDKRQWAAVVDRFGAHAFVIAETATHVTIRVDVQCSKAFYAWLFKFGTDVQIVAPANVQAAYVAHMQAVLNSYSE